MQEVLVIHQRLVHFFPVEQQGHGLADLFVIKGESPHVHGKALEADGLLVVNPLFYNMIVKKRAARGLLDPYARGIYGKQIDAPLFEGLESIFALGEKPEGDGVEIEFVLLAETILLPPVLPAFELDSVAFINAPRPVWPGNDRKLEYEPVEVHIPVGMFR